MKKSIKTKKLTRFERAVSKLPRHPSGMIHPLYVNGLLACEHRAVVRKVKGMPRCHQGIIRTFDGNRWSKIEYINLNDLLAWLKSRAK